ncbi:AAA family ATPase [Patescibacteria group bacterium]|nr:AAA family ATPase [Patescibacteria group bacterium]
MLIGITGTDGAGKGTVVEYLVKQKGYLHFASRGYLTRELNRRGLYGSRANLREVANELRAHNGDGHLVTVALRQVHEEAWPYLIIESIRAVAEVEALHAAGGVLLAVDAPVAVRYERIVGRGSASDHVSFEEFVAQETLEMNDPDPHGMQKARVLAMADYTIINAGLYSDLEAATEIALAALEQMS